MELNEYEGTGSNPVHLAWCYYHVLRCFNLAEEGFVPSYSLPSMRAVRKGVRMK